MTVNYSYMPFCHEPDYATIMEMNQVKTATEEN